LPAIIASIDALLVLGNLAYSHWGIGLEGSLFSIFPVSWVVPITMAAAAIHYQPRLQVYVAAVYVIGLSLMAFGEPWIGPRGTATDLGQLGGFFSPQSNFVRVMMVLAAALILILVARQGRLLLERAVRETTLRVNLTRYLPRELAPILSDRAFDALRAGQRITATLLFVDIRDSSAIGENMDPARLAIFISAFRRRVIRAAAQHGGMIDKFAGDGALILFGVPEARPDDAARALACGRTLLDLVERWNAKRDFDPPLRIGIGIHTGEMFCGVVGDEDRLEFTVLGETVNTAARIEQATKAVECDCLASQDAVMAAGESHLWTTVDGPSLPGVTRPIVLMGPKGSTS
jgi:adenylate cyclase